MSALRQTLKFNPSQFKSPFRLVYSLNQGQANTAPVALQNFTPQKPNHNQVMVRMLAAPINPADMNQIQGTYGALNGKPNGAARSIHGDQGDFYVAGGEGVGVVEQVGDNVQGLKVGQRVIPSAPSMGTWSSHITSEANEWMPVDEDIPLEYAATIGVNPSTAYRMLNDFGSHLKKGDTIVQNGASSMVGYSLTQLARDKGLNVINIFRTRPDEGGVQERLNELGGSVSVSDTFAGRRKFREMIKELPTPKLGFNGVGGEQMSIIGKLVDDNSTIVTYGGMSRRPITIPTSSFIFRNLQYRGFWMSRWILENSQEERRKMIQELSEKIKSKDLVLFMETWKMSEFDLAFDEYHKEFRPRKQVLLFDEL